MKIAIITTRGKEGRGPSVMDEVVGSLCERGARVEMICPEDQLIDVARVRVEHDLYVLKSSAEAALSFTAVLHAAGARTLNPYPVVQAMKDKVVATKILQAADVPLPDTFITTEASRLREVLAEGPLVVKPFWGGSQGRGVQIVETAEELDNIESSHGVLFAQRYHKPDGRDHKIYSIGDRIFGVMRVWPARTYEEKLGEPFEVSAGMREITLRCGRAFGIDLFGLDIIESQGRPYVVDINTFPGFKGVPDAARLLADYIHSAAGRALAGEPLLPAVEK
jgi:ribosomal protein S6--L-glutamate ligase